MRKVKEKMITIIAAFALAFTAVPVMSSTVYAASPSAINLIDGDGKVTGITGAQGSSVYFGKYNQSSDGAGGFNKEPVKWRVLSQDSDNGTLFMLSDKNLDCKKYNEQYTSITWGNSTIRGWLNGTGDDSFIDNAFSQNEKASVATTRVENKDNDEWGTPGGSDTEDKIFLLSYDESINTAYGFTDNRNETSTREAKNTDYAKSRGAWTSETAEYAGNGDWWLRSPAFNDAYAAVVSGSGWITGYGSFADNDEKAVRPAFNLDLKSAIFASSAEGGKSSGTVGADYLTSIGENPSDEWKMTVKDTAHQNFTVESVTGCEKNDLTVKYSGAVAGENEYISAIIKKSDGSIKYYGRLGLASAAAGSTVKVNVDGKLEESDTLCIFNEQCNGDYETDYASPLQEVTVKTTGHDWGDWKVTRAATEKEEGEETRVCKNDETHIERRSIEKLKPEDKPDDINPTEPKNNTPGGDNATHDDTTEAPKNDRKSSVKRVVTGGKKTKATGTIQSAATGDENRAELWMLLTCICSAAIPAAVIYRKKKRSRG